MSSSLYWRPVPKEEPPKHHLDSTLKKTISRRYWDHDGSDWGDEITLGKEDIPYFQGLADAGVPDAQAVIDAIRAEGRILIWIGE